MGIKQMKEKVIKQLHVPFALKEGAILVFLPGWDDISKVHDKLKEDKLLFSSGIQSKKSSNCYFKTVFTRDG